MLVVEMEAADAGALLLPHCRPHAAACRCYPPLAGTIRSLETVTVMTQP